MVFAADVCIFMSNHVLHILFIHMERQINLRLYKAKYKGRNNIFALKNIIKET